MSTHFKLNTGAEIPAIGLGRSHLSLTWSPAAKQLTLNIGTWKSEPGEVRRAVSYALKDGYRHIDAALSVLLPHCTWIES